MEDNMNLEENIVENEEIVSSTEENDISEEIKNADNAEQEEEYYFTADELRKQKKRQEQRLKRVAKEEKYRNRNLGRMYRSSAAIAVFAGIMQIIMGLPKEDGITNIMLGATFICCGYLFYTMGAKADREKKKKEENR